MFSHADRPKNCTKKYFYQIRRPKESTLALKRLLRVRNNTSDLTKRIQFFLICYSKMMPSVTGKFFVSYEHAIYSKNASQGRSLSGIISFALPLK